MDQLSQIIALLSVEGQATPAQAGVRRIAACADEVGADPLPPGDGLRTVTLRTMGPMAMTFAGTDLRPIGGLPLLAYLLHAPGHTGLLGELASSVLNGSARRRARHARLQLATIRSNLQRCASRHLNKGAVLIRCAHGTWALNGALAWKADFLTILDSRDADGILRLYRGDFLEHLSTDWALEMRARLQKHACHVLDAAVQQAGPCARSLGWLAGAVCIDPDPERLEGLQSMAHALHCRPFLALAERYESACLDGESLFGIERPGDPLEHPPALHPGAADGRSSLARLPR